MNKRNCNNIYHKKQNSYLPRPFNVLPRTSIKKYITKSLKILID